MKELQRFLEKYWVPLLLALLILGFWVRSLIPLDVTSFGYDQARDAQRIADMVTVHHVKLVGPETDIPGVFNGPLLYYILLPIYLVSHFSPFAAVIFFMLVNLGIGLLLFTAGKVFFKSTAVGLVSFFLWLFSYDQIWYSHYISNASLMGLGATIFFLGLAIYFLRKKAYGLPLSVIGLAVAIQANFYLVYLAIFYGIFFYLYPRKHSLKWMIGSMLLLVALLSPFVVAELKWHFMMTKSLLSYMSKQGGIHTLSSSLLSYIDKIGEAIYYSFFSFNVFFGLLITGGIVSFGYVAGKQKKEVFFVLLWALSTLPLFGFSSGVLTTHVVNLTILPALTLLIAYGVWNLFVTKKYMLLAISFVVLLILGNMKLLVANDFTIASTMMSYRSEKQVIDYTYQQAHGRPFSICTVSDPLFINTAWSYLYDHYGLPKYHYMPFWAGQQQYANTNMLPYDSTHTPLRFLIVESFGVPDFVPRVVIFAEDHASKLLQTQKFGELTVQERMLQQKPRQFIDTQGLSYQQASEAASLLHATPLYSCFNTYTSVQ